MQMASINFGPFDRNVSLVSHTREKMGVGWGQGEEALKSQLAVCSLFFLPQRMIHITLGNQGIILAGKRNF